MFQQNELLIGIRVIDLSQYIPGPFATRQLSDLGADVIKIESPQGDPMQTLFQDSDGRSPIYEHLNRGKRILRLDLKTTSDLEALKKLISDSDILLESFRPGVLDRLGLDRDTLNDINPLLIHCSLSGFGQNGPYAQKAGHDLTYCAVGGALGLSGTTEKPVMSFPPIADHAGAMQAINTILAALVSKLRRGTGCYIDISLFEPILSWQYLHLLEDNSQRESMQLNGGLACYRLYQTSDKRFVALAALEAKFWKLFCEAVGQEAWISRHNESRPQEDLINELEKFFMKHPQAHWVKLLAAVDCCFEAVPNAGEITAHPQLQARQMMQDNGPAYPAWINNSSPTASTPPKVITLPLSWYADNTV